MRTQAILSNVVFPLAFSLLATSATAGVIPLVDGYVCHKVKDLKTPALIATTPDVPGVLSYIGTTSCDLGKMSSICMPAYIDLSTPVNAFVAQCCFKAKCAADLTPTSLVVDDISSGVPTFGGEVETNKKISTICLPCDYGPVP